MSDFLPAAALSLALVQPCAAGLGMAAPFQYAQRSVVKIYVTMQQDDFALPWQASRPMRATGTGFIVQKRRILTNAHVVSDARVIQIQKDGDPRPYNARVEFIGHDCDLATLTVEDESFFEGTASLSLADDLPRLGDTVNVLGYPMGGDRLSLTRGIVSRIDYSVYSHTGVDHHLVLQVDAAINPGNSGGPVLFGGRVAGLAFQGLSWAENIGYAIPVPVLRHFLGDIEDGTYNGYPELGAAFTELRNAALRESLKLPRDLSGVVVHYLDPFGSGFGVLRDRDIILTVDGHSVQDDGTVKLNGNTVSFSELLERKQWGEAVGFKLWRDGGAVEVNVPLKNPFDPFAFRRIYDRRPEYVTLAGLVFSPLSRNYVERLGKSLSDENANHLLYVTRFAKMDGLHKDRDEFVVLIRRLPHPVNTYAGDFVNGIVTEIDGVAVRNLRDFAQALAKPKGNFHVIRFAGMDDALVMDVSAAGKAAPEIMQRYGVPAGAHFEQ